MLQSSEKPRIPSSAFKYSPSIYIDATQVINPSIKNTGHTLYPKLYSVLITTGWNSPMIIKAITPIMIQENAINPFFLSDFDQGGSWLELESHPDHISTFYPILKYSFFMVFSEIVKIDSNYPESAFLVE